MMERLVESAGESNRSDGEAVPGVAGVPTL